MRLARLRQDRFFSKNFNDKIKGKWGKTKVMNVDDCKMTKRAE